MGNRKNSGRKGKKRIQENKKPESRKQENRSPELIHLTCTNCHGSLEMTGEDRIKCPYCGYDYLLDKAEGIFIYVDVDYAKSRELRRAIGYMNKIMGPFFLMALVALGLIFLYNRGAREEVGYYYLDRAPEEEADRELGELFCEDVFGKSFGDITPQELASIRYFELDSRYYGDTGTYNNIRYSFADYRDFDREEDFQETLRTWTYNTDYISENQEELDFSMLTGLNRIDIRYCDRISNMKFSPKCDISYVYASHLPGEIAEVVNPAGVEVLHIRRKDGDETNLKGIEQYSRLKELKCVDSLGLAHGLKVDIRALSACKNLERLHLECGAAYTGLETLREFPGLTSLYLDNATLTECEFLKEMPKLRELSIKCGDARAFSLLSGLENLKVLWILDNETVDGEQLASLTGLQELRVSVVGKEGLEALAGLSHLKTLSIDISSYSFDSVLDLSPLAALKELESAYIRCDWNFYIGGMEKLLQLPKLTGLTINADYGPAVYLLVDTRELSQEGQPENGELQDEFLQGEASNNTLQFLCLKDCNIVDTTTGQPAYYEMLTYCRGVRELELTNAGITDLGFVSEMPGLGTLKLLENKVDSFAPLSHCKTLSALYLDKDLLSNQNKDELEKLSAGVKVSYEE